MLLGLARETHNHVRGQRYVWHTVPYSVDEAAVLVHGVASHHSFQRQVMSRLDRQFDVFADFIQFCDRPDDPLAHVVGMRGQEPDTPQMVDFMDRAQQVRKVGSVRQIMTVGIHVLAQKRHLSCASIYQASHLLHDLGHGTTALSASPQPDDAVGTEVVATMDDRDVAGDRSP